MFWPLVMDEGIPRLVGYGLAFVTCNSLTFATQNTSQCWICADPWLLNAPASAVIHLFFFVDPLLLISSLKICFWCMGFFDTLLNLVALNMYDSSHHAIVSMILTSISILPIYALHPYPLYSIPGMLQQSGLTLPSKIASKSVVSLVACFLKAIDSVIDFATPSASSSGSEAGCELLQLQHRPQRSLSLSLLFEESGIPAILACFLKARDSASSDSVGGEAVLSLAWDWACLCD